MLKSMIAPIQAWLLSQGKCVGCGKELPLPKGSGFIRMVCECGRIYMYDSGTGKFRRAKIDENP